MLHSPKSVFKFRLEYVIPLLAILLVPPACHKDGDTTKAKETPKGVGQIALAPPSIVAQNLTAVSSAGLLPTSLNAQNYSPGALTIDLPKSLGLLTAYDPCAGISGGWWSCVPRLLIEYLATAPFAFESFVPFIDPKGSSTGPAIEKAWTNTPEGGSTDFDPNFGGLAARIHKSRTDYEVLLTQPNGTPYLHIRVSKDSQNHDLYEFRSHHQIIDWNGHPYDLGHTILSIAFSSAENWEVRNDSGQIPCAAEAINNPENYRIVIRRTSGVWQSRVMAYHPHVAPQSCETSAPNTLSSFYYMESISSDSQSKANLFVGPILKSTDVLTDISGTLLNSFTPEKYCEAFTGEAQDPFYCGEAKQESPSSFRNPWCIVVDRFTPGSACESDPLVSPAPFDMSEPWLPIADLIALDVAVPSQIP